MSTNGMIWINDGEIQKMIPSEDEIPKGFYQGMLPKNTKNYYWINKDGKNRRVSPSEMEYLCINEGYRPGRIIRK